MSGAPFGTGEGIGAEVAEHVDFHSLPCQLGVGWHGSEGLGPLAGGGQREGCQCDSEALSHGEEAVLVGAKLRFYSDMGNIFFVVSFFLSKWMKAG